MILIVNGRLYTVVHAIWYSLVLVLRNSDYQRNRINRDLKSYSYTEGELLHCTFNTNLINLFLREYFIESSPWIMANDSPGNKVIWQTKNDDEIKMVTSLVWTDIMTWRTRCPSGILYVYLIEVKRSVFGIIMANSTPI